MKNKTSKIMAILFAVVLMAISCTSAFAAESPTGGKAVNVVVTPSEGGSAKYEAVSEVGKGPNGGTLIAISPVANDGYTFTEWTITGEFFFNSGSFYSADAVIEAFGDITAVPNFTKSGSSDATSPSATTAAAASGSSSGSSTSVVTNTSKTSPQTGTTPVLPIAVSAIALASIGAVIVSRKLSK